jgi:hypothetical protein
MKRKHLTETPVCPRERLVIISYTTGLSFALKRIGPLAAIIIILFYLLIFYLLALPNTPENQFASIYSESLIKTACQHLLHLVGFDTLIYRKYYDTPPILLGHQGFRGSSWSPYVCEYMEVLHLWCWSRWSKIFDDLEVGYVGYINIACAGALIPCSVFKGMSTNTSLLLQHYK